MRNRRVAVLVVGTVIFLFALSGLLFQHQDNWDFPIERLGRKKNHGPWKDTRPVLPKNSNLTSPLAHHFMERIMRPSVDVDHPQYSPYGAFGWGLPDGPRRWNESLGERLCIIDLDNRPFSEPGQLWAETPMSWDRPKEVHGLSVGVLNHWLFSKIHGYKYYYVDIEEFEDRRNSWKKPPVLAQILRNHDVCIFVDSDAIFNHLDLPFEWLLNYWSLAPESNSLALALDPPEDHNKDKFGKYYLNTGFIIAQHNDRTFDIFDAWADCPEETGRHPECVKFRKNVPGQPTDQGGFGNYIRYDFPRDIKELPCSEANGFPQSGSACQGDFIKHLWTGKDDWIKIAIGEQIPGDLLEIFHKQFLAEKQYFYVTEEDLMSFSKSK